MSQRIAYLRVSSLEQNLDRQYELVGKCDKYFADKLSGKNTNRPELQAMLNHIREGDILVVADMSRLGRDTLDTLKIIDELAKQGVTLEFIKEGLTIGGQSSSWQQFQLQMLAAMAQLERSQIRERQAEGIAAAKAAGKHLGRAPKLSQDQIQEIRMLSDQGENKNVIAEKYNVSRVTIYRALLHHGTNGPVSSLQT